MPKPHRDYTKPFEEQDYNDTNEGQTRYAYEQYMLARVRHGLENSSLSDNQMDNSRMDVNEVSSSNAKVGESQIVPPLAKKRKADGQGGASSGIGTGSNTDGSAPAGSGGDMAITCIQRPLTHLNSNKFVFRKHHKVFTWGLAYNILPNIYQGHRQIITPLCEIPWDRPYWYLNPNEFEMLPTGTKCTELHVSVRQRNVRVAFEVASSATNIATLNQNKDVIFAEGLNMKVNGNNVKVESFEAGKPMICNAITDATYTDFPEKLYGYRGNASADFTSKVPHHQFGTPIVLQNYFAVWTPDRLTATNCGWPCLNKYVEKNDANETASKVLVECSYRPLNGYLKQPIAYVQGLDSVGTESYHVYLGTKGSTAGQINITNFNNTGDGTFTGANPFEIDRVTHKTSTDSPISNSSLYKHHIEKAQNIGFGLFNKENPRAQPSLHVGINPVYSLSTTSIIDDQILNYTDSSVEFEIECEMVCEVDYPVEYPLGGFGVNHRDADRQLYYLKDSSAGAPSFTDTTYIKNPMINNLYAVRSDGAAQTRSRNIVESENNTENSNNVNKAKKKLF